jgi:hypothetical protein
MRVDCASQLIDRVAFMQLHSGRIGDEVFKPVTVISGFCR